MRDTEVADRQCYLLHALQAAGLICCAGVLILHGIHTYADEQTDAGLHTIMYSWNTVSHMQTFV